MKFGLIAFFLFVTGMAVLVNIARDASRQAIACLFVYFLVGLGMAWYFSRARQRIQSYTALFRGEGSSMGVYGGVLEPTAALLESWRDALRLPGTTLDESGCHAVVRRGDCSVEVFEATWPANAPNAKPILVVQTGGFRRRTREANAGLADEIIAALIVAGANKLEKPARTK